jgi:FkbM family methyltransferase
MSFQEKRFAREYEKRLTEEGYPGNLLEKVLCEIKGSSSIIDIGSGTGFFTIPLLKQGYRVIAIEPSGEMIKIFKKKVEKELLPSLKIYNEEWESWEGDRADSLICIHSIYGMHDIKSALQRMRVYSSKSIVIVKADSGRKTLSSIIGERMNKKMSTRGFYGRIVRALHESGTDFNSQEIEQSRDSHFSDIDKEAQYYCYHLGLDKSNLNAVRDIIRAETDRYEHGYIFRGIYRDYLITF